MRIQVVALAGGNEAIRGAKSRADAYFELLDALASLDVRRHGRLKSKPEYVYDQSELIERARAILVGLGWKREAPLAGPYESLGVRLAGVRTDTAKAGVHVIFEFGNRASYAYNTLTRFALGCAAGGMEITVFVVPTLGFANAIDSNLASFERLVGEFQRLEAVIPRVIPGPLVVVGAEPDDMG